MNNPLPAPLFPNVISRIFNLTLIGMCLLIMMIILMFLFLYWVEDLTAYEHDDVFSILDISQLLMIYICLFVLGMDPEAHD